MVPWKSHRPLENRAPRCGHQSVSATTWPCLPRKSTGSSPSIFRRTGRFLPTFLAWMPGYQYSRKPSRGQKSNGPICEEPRASSLIAAWRFFFCSSGSCSVLSMDGLSSGPSGHEALRGIEDVRLDEVDDLRLGADLGEGPGQAHPVQELLLAGALDVLHGQVLPEVRLAVAELLEARQIGRVVRPEHVVLVDQERVRPARGAQEHRAVTALLERACGGRADVEAEL